MGRQRNNPQMKGKEEAIERMLNEIEARQLSDIEFKAIVIGKLNETEDQISGLEDQVEKDTQKEQEKKKGLRKNEEGLREMQDNMK